jgi:hypothetical protein
MDRVQKLFAFDKIRLGKIIEILQSSFVSVMIATIFGFLFKKVKSYLFDNKGKESESLFYLYLRVSIEVFLITVLVFYLRKMILVIPSVASFFIKGFQPYTTMEYSMHMCIVVLTIELFSDLHESLDILKAKLF